MVTLEVGGYFILKTLVTYIFIRNCLCKTKFVLNLRLLRLHYVSFRRAKALNLWNGPWCNWQHVCFWYRRV